MSSPTYQAIVFLQEGSDFDVDVAAGRLSEQFPEMEVVRKGNGITVSNEDWRINLHLAEEPFVAEENREMADWFAQCSTTAEIAACKRRVDVWSTEPDPQMDHFNDYLFVCHVMESFRGVILFDPQAGEPL